MESMNCGSLICVYLKPGLTEKTYSKNIETFEIWSTDNGGGWGRSAGGTMGEDGEDKLEERSRKQTKTKQKQTNKNKQKSPEVGNEKRSLMEETLGWSHNSEETAGLTKRYK